jgi:hypothetical protein
MCQALELARQTVAAFISKCPGCFPPIVINITDGQATDGDIAPPGAAVRDLCSSDGNVLLFNIHISSRQEKPILYPAGDELLPDAYSKLLFRISSPLPAEMLKQAQGVDGRIVDGARGFVFNGDLVSVIQFLDIGTRVDQRSH